MVKKTLLIVGLGSVVVSGIYAEDVKKGAFNLGIVNNSDIQIHAAYSEDVPKIGIDHKIKLQNDSMVLPKASSGYRETIIYARSAKKSYAVKEPIKIQLELKEDAYIYFWTVSQDDGRGYLILPNHFESFNSYKKGTAYVVPEKDADYQFYSDRKGSEVVYVLATNKRITPKKIEDIFSDRVNEKVPVATKKNIERFVTKDIQVIAKEQALKFVIKTFKIDIKSK